MYEYLFICRSVTHAQLALQALQSAGIRGQMYRAPKGLTERGCAYAVRVSGAVFERAAEQLKKEHISPYQVYAHSGERYIEVRQP